jgi:hypothetical protein
VSRRIFFCRETWADRQFKKRLERLRPDERASFLGQLECLYAALVDTPHPATDPSLRQAFKAKSYSGVVALRGASLLEYSLGKLSRVIAKDPATEDSNDILLIAVTLDHDHERLKRLIKDHRTAIDGRDADSDR